jgi:hypothetical protein
MGFIRGWVSFWEKTSAAEVLARTRVDDTWRS